MPNDRRDALFEEALALPPAERAAYLASACAGDAVLRAEVASLLTAHDAAEGFFESLSRDAAQPLHESLGMREAGADSDPLAIGDVVAHYRVDARLGRGGMGVVYKATDLRLERAVALKVLPMSRATDAGARARLLDEARAAAALEHPHIGTILDVGTLDGGLSVDRMYIAMTFYEGETLAERLAQGPVPVADSLRIGRQLASALAAAHEAGVVHRDVKPSNVLLARAGDVRLVDFGIAARVGVALPHTTAARGTRRYMSPERASGAPSDPRADVWSLGLVLRDLLDARPEPSATTLPESIASLLHRCLDPDPARRPAHAGEVLVVLDAIRDEPDMAREESPAATVVTAPSAVPAGASGTTFASDRMPPRATSRFRRVAALAFAGVAVVLLGWQLRTRDHAPAAVIGNARTNGEPGNRVLVLPFEDQSSDAELAAFGVLAADFVTEAIAATPFAEAVPAITALALSRDGIAAPPGVDRLVHLARPVAAAWVIAGTYLVQGDSLLVRAALSSGHDGRVVRTLRTVVSPRSAPGEALAVLARSAVVVTALELDPRVRTDAVVLTIPPKWDAYEAYARGKEHFLARRYGQAVQAFNEAHARDSSFRWPLFYEGMVHVNTGDWDRLEAVVGEYRQRVTARSDRTEQLALRILDAFLSGDSPTIYRVHREAEAAGMIGPGGLGHFSMGAAAIDVGRPREAIEIVRQSDPDRGELKDWSSYYDVLAQAHLWLGESEAALDAARRLQADHPGLDLGPRRAIEALAQAGRVQAVDSVLVPALSSMPDPGGLLRFAGNVLHIAGHEEAARRQYARALAYERDALRRAAGLAEVNARAALGESLLLVGELDEAESLFRTLATENPGLMDPPTALGRIAARRRDSVGVAAIDRELADRASQRWNRGRATYRRARLAAVQGDGARAARLLEQAWREGFTIYYVVWTDPEFAGVRSHPAMRALLAPKG